VLFITCFIAAETAAGYTLERAELGKKYGSTRNDWKLGIWKPGGSTDTPRQSGY